jgi:dCMP deaminase
MSNQSNRYQQKIAIFSKIAEEVSSLSVSSRLKVGALAVRYDFTKIASFGYNGSYKNAPVNPITGTEEDSLVPGESGLIHAEINMIAKFREQDPENYIVILTHSPCKMCTKTLVNAGFKEVYWVNDYRETDHLKIFDSCEVSHGNIKDLKC